MVSICDGALVLANSGVLDGHRATAHWATADYRRKTLALIEEDYGRRIAIDAARQMVVFTKRAGGQSQFSVPLAAQTTDQGFVELHAWIAANLAADLSVGQLAARAGMAPRTFARAYAAKMGRTPAKTVELMRIEAACRALEETSLPLKSIAQRTSHGDEQNLRRAFQRQLVTNPTTHRLRFSSLLP